MAAPSTKAEDVALYGPEAPSQGIGPWGVIAFTISTDAGKARALGKLAGGESLVAAARLVPAVIPATSNLAFQFRIDPHVIGQADAWRAARASRLDYFLWISHAGPGFISAAEGRTIGAAEIEWMELVPPPPGQTGKEKSERNIRMKKIEESRRKLGKKAEGLRERTVGASIRSYIRLDSLADLIAACRPRVIHIASCSFGKQGGRDVPGVRAVNGPVALAKLVRERLYNYSGVMTYSSVDTALSADNPHIRPGDPGSDTNRLLISEGKWGEGATAQEARDFLAAIVEEEARQLAELKQLVPKLGGDLASHVGRFLGF